MNGWDGKCARVHSSCRCSVSAHVDAALSRHWNCVALLAKTRVGELPLFAGRPDSASVYQLTPWLGIMQDGMNAASLPLTAPGCPLDFLTS